MKYVTIPAKAQWDIWEKPATVQTTMTVYETDDVLIKTGLLDVTGSPLYRVKEKEKLGYV